MTIRNFTEEQLAKLKQCNTTEDMQTYANSLGIRLTEDDLSAIVGGKALAFNTESKEANEGKGGRPFILDSNTNKKIL